MRIKNTMQRKVVEMLSTEYTQNMWHPLTQLSCAPYKCFG